MQLLFCLYLAEICNLHQYTPTLEKTQEKKTSKKVLFEVSNLSLQESLSSAFSKEKAKLFSTAEILLFHKEDTQAQ